jgi:hypothetical protein
MARYLSGPPGGRTLPLTPTRLSDLAGGVYGPGASVASTGMNGQRPAIKAARARAAGETWEDILEYYIVSFNPLLIRTYLSSRFSSTQTVGKPTLPSVSERYSTMAAYTMQRVASHLAVKVLVGYHGTSSERVTTSSPSRVKCGRPTRVTYRESVMKIARWALRRLRLVI